MTYTSQFSSQTIQTCIPTCGYCWCAKLQWSKPKKTRSCASYHSGLCITTSTV